MGRGIGIGQSGDYVNMSFGFFFNNRIAQRACPPRRSTPSYTRVCTSG